VTVALKDIIEAPDVSAFAGATSGREDRAGALEGI